MNNAYVQGFMDKCAAIGIDPVALVKRSQLGVLGSTSLNPEDISTSRAASMPSGAELRRHRLMLPTLDYERATPVRKVPAPSRGGDMYTAERASAEGLEYPPMPSGKAIREARRAKIKQKDSDNE